MTTLREKIAVMIERATGIGGMDSRAEADEIIQLIKDEMPLHEDYTDFDSDHCSSKKDGWNAYRTKVLKKLDEK